MLITLSALMAQCAPEVAPSTLAAIVAVESGGNAFAIGVNKGVRVRQPTNAAEAVAIAKGLLARGANIDLGLGQINSSNLRWLGLSVEAAFDPCQNLAAAARVLTGNYRRAVSLGHTTPLGAALSAYNTGSMQRGYRNGYVAKIYRASPRRRHGDRGACDIRQRHASVAKLNYAEHRKRPRMPPTSQLGALVPTNGLDKESTFRCGDPVPNA